MGEVYEASDRELGVAVALKTIRYDRPGAAADSLDRVREEVKIARKVTHPNVCRIFDVGRDGARIYFTMELVHGDTLASVLRRGRLSAAVALPLARQMAEGLDALHHQGIVEACRPPPMTPPSYLECAR